MVLRSGVMKTDITPPVGVPLAGYTEKERDVGNLGVHDPLYARALILDDGENRMALVSLDLIGVDIEFTSKVRKLIEEQTDIEGKDVILTCTHTHCGPLGTVMREERSYFLDKFRRFFGIFESIREFYSWKIAGAVLEAERKMSDSKLGVGSTEIPPGVICTNRRDPKGPMDPEALILRVDSESLKPSCILTNYACHPTVLNYRIIEVSADFPGVAMSLVENTFPGCVSMYVNGAQGNVSTRWTRREQSFSEAERIGRIFGSEIIKSAEMIKTSEDVEIRMASKTVKLPLRKLPSLEEAERIFDERKRILEELKEKNAPYGEIRVAYTALEGAKYLLEYVKHGSIKKKSIETEIQVFSMNDTAFVSIPGEMFNEFQLMIKKRSKFEKTFVMGLANDYVGYILTPEAYDEGLYESWTTILSRDAGQILFREIMKLMDSIMVT
ncbi:MAG: neutral/alkaline non-lysosomal ceramidase N-terminal domain-containing protein [Candidatus Asgardarchaeia archaeon]